MTRFCLRAASLVSALVVLWPLALYPLILRLLQSHHPTSRKSATQTRTVTVILPTYNEVSNVAARLHNIAASQFPADQLDVVVVDSGSADGTAACAEATARGLAIDVTVIREDERRGKAAAINRAISVARGDILVITDAPTVFEPDALSHVAGAFDDPQVGAASGHFEVTGEGSALQVEEASFWKVRNTLRSLEAGVDSTPFLSGELCAFRRGLITELDEDTLADDMNVALQIRQLGYRVVIVPEARFSERRTAEARELVETKSRRAAGGIQELLRFRSMMLRPSHGLFGILILPSALVYYLPLRLPALAILAGAVIAVTRRTSQMSRLIALLATLAAIPLAVTRAQQISMLLFNEWIFVLGWRRILARRMDVRWSQERSTREVAQEGLPE